jgi:predicted dehydrogenase
MNSSSTPFRFVIIGSGNISRTYLRAIAQLPDVQAAGVVSRSGRRPEGLQPRPGSSPRSRT